MSAQAGFSPFLGGTHPLSASPKNPKARRSFGRPVLIQPCRFGRGGGGSRKAEGIPKASPAFSLLAKRRCRSAPLDATCLRDLKSRFAGIVLQTPPCLPVVSVCRLRGCPLCARSPTIGWSVKPFAGTHTAPPLAALPLTPAAYPLRILYPILPTPPVPRQGDCGASRLASLVKGALRIRLPQADGSYPEVRGPPHGGRGFPHRRFCQPHL